MPKLPTVTADDVMAWNPCYDEKRVRDTLAERERWTALDVLDLDDVEFPDRCWVIMRDAMVPRELWIWLQCDYAGSVIYMYEHHAPGDTTLRWCLDEARAARSARDAARAAAWDAAWDAARATVKSAWDAAEAAEAASWAARAAAVAASGDAGDAWAVAVAAAVATARAAEIAWQIDHARTLIEGWRDWPTDDIRAYLDTLVPVEDWPIETGGEVIP